jgi:hypothetical protein
MTHPERFGNVVPQKHRNPVHDRVVVTPTTSEDRTLARERLSVGRAEEKSRVGNVE